MSDLARLSRNIRRSPVSAIAAVLTLTMTIGAGASIFAVVDAVLLTPPPFANPDALVTLGETPIDAPSSAPRTVAYATFQAWRERAGAFATLEAFDGTNVTLTGVGAAERLSVSDVTTGFLSVLGVSPALGRTFRDDDLGRPLAIVSDGFWRGKLASDPAVIGRELVLGGQVHTIIGVLPGAFSFALNRSDLWRPLPFPSAAGDGYRVGVVARLAQGASPTSLANALDDVSRASRPPSHVAAADITAVVAGGAKTTLPVLAWAAAIAILIAFINLAGLLIVRLFDRRRELAVRIALGARQSQIAKQLLWEAVAIASMGTLGGIVLAVWLTPLAGQLAVASLGNVANRSVAMNWPIIGLVTVAALACATVCGSITAIHAARWDAVEVLRRGATPAPREARLRRVFVTAEVALAFVLLVSMALLSHTLILLTGVNPGFDPRGVLALQVSLPTASYASNERVTSFYSTLQNALESRLGSRAVSIVDEIPLSGDRGRRLVSMRPTDTSREAVVRSVSPNYFDVMRIPVIAGRSFELEDNAAVRPHVVVSQSLGKMLFGLESPVGRQISLGAQAQTAEVVGVVDDVKHRALDEMVLPTVYLSAWQEPSPSSVVVIRSQRPDVEVIAAVREEVARLDGSLPVYRVRSMSEVVASSPGVEVRRVLTATFGAFALLAVVLSAIGLFGVVAHDIASRRTELALRMALGARPMRILFGVLRQGVLMVGSGLALGGLLSVWATRALSTTVIGTGRADFVSASAAALVLMLTGAAAMLPPARRALRTDCLIVLRGE
jgi:putative ABC transport system permease protein